MTAESEQHINEMRAVQAEVLSSIAEPTSKVGYTSLIAGVLGKAGFPLLKSFINEEYLQYDELETFSAIALYGGAATIVIARILENASRNIIKRLPRELQTQMTWDRIKAKK